MSSIKKRREQQKPLERDHRENQAMGKVGETDDRCQKRALGIDKMVVCL
jgi:hypothetical protein